MNTTKSIKISYKGPFSQSSSAPLYFSTTTRNIAPPVILNNQKNIIRNSDNNVQDNLSIKK